MNADIWEIIRLAVVVVMMMGLGAFIIRKQPTSAIQETRRVETTTDMRRTIDDLNITVRALSRQLDDAYKRIIALETENTALRASVTELEKQIKETVRVKVMPLVPLEVIVGNLKTFERDRSALRRAGIAFRRVMDATKPLIIAELRRRRQDGTLSPWWLVSAHASAEGIELCDGVAPPTFWHDMMDGVDLVILAACETSTTADELAGLVDTVIWFHESVPNQDAADFNYALFKRLVAGMNIDQAYAESLREVPAVAEFVDIRHA